MIIGSIWTDVKTAATEAGKVAYKAGAELVTKELPAAVQSTVTKKALETAAPYAQKVAVAQTKAAISKGNVALLAAIGAAVGGLLGWKQRWYVGAPIGALLGGIAGFKIGLLKD